MGIYEWADETTTKHITLPEQIYDVWYNHGKIYCAKSLLCAALYNFILHVTVYVSQGLGQFCMFLLYIKHLDDKINETNYLWVVVFLFSLPFPFPCLSEFLQAKKKTS